MDFVDKLNALYNTHLIYRTIVVCDGDVCEYKRRLEKNEFSVYVVEDADADYDNSVNYDNSINYDALDCRVILIDSKRIESFLKNTMNMNTFYTFITFTNDNDSAKEAIMKLKQYNDIIK